MLSVFWTQVFIRPLTNLLIFLYNIVPGHDLGISIIILTIIIRLILYPSSRKAIKSQRAMQNLQPQLDKIKEKHKDDKQKQTQETLKLYQENKISPFSSCLPLLIQMPILIALYWVFRKVSVEDVSGLLYSFIYAPQNFSPYFLGLIDLTKPEVYVLPVLAGASQFIQSWMILRRSKKEHKPDEKVQDIGSAISKQMTYIFPIITIIFAASLPAAIALYWITTNLFSIVQQYIIMKEENSEPKAIVRKK